MRKLLDNCLGSLVNRAGIIKLVALAFLVIAATAAQAQPTNDNFANATVIAGTFGTTNGSTALATAESGEPDHAGNPGGPYASIWYQWTSPINGTMEFNTEGSGFDTVMAVYTGSNVSALTVVASNDDVSFPSDLTSRVTFPVTNGGVYNIAVDGYGGLTGPVVLSWSQSGALSAGTFQFASSSTASGGPTYIISEHESFETVIENVMVPYDNGARARVTRTAGSAGLVHVAYTVTNTLYTNYFVTNIFGTNVYLANLAGTNITNIIITNSMGLPVSTNSVTNLTGWAWTNVLNTNISSYLYFADNVQGSWVDGAGRLLYCVFSNGTTINISNDYTGLHVRTATNYPAPLPVPNQCPLNTNFYGYATNSSTNMFMYTNITVTIFMGTNTNSMSFTNTPVTNLVSSTNMLVYFMTNVYCTNFTTTNYTPSAIPNVDYEATTGVVDFKDYQMGADIPLYIFPAQPTNVLNRVVIVTLNSVTLDTNEATNVIVPPILTASSNALVNVLSQEVLGVQPDLCGTTNLIFNLDKTVWTCGRDISGSNAYVWVVCTVNDPTASGSINYRIDYSGGKGVDNNDNFALQPGSDYATPGSPLPTLPPSSQPADFTTVTGTVNFGPNNFNPKPIVIPIINNNLVTFNEDMHIELYNPTGGTNGQITTATLTILFDDQPAGAIDRAYNPDNNQNTSPPFNLNPGANKSVYACLIQPDGRAVIGGNFTAYNTIPLNSVARVNTDGSLDTTFLAAPNSGVDGTIDCLAIATNNAIYIGGSFTSFNGTNRYSIARLNPDGSLDSSFNPGVGVQEIGGTNGIVTCMAVQPDGRLIIAGSFTTVDATNCYNIARLDTNGSLDLTFNVGTGPNGIVYTLALQTNVGTVSPIIGGAFTLVNGVARQCVARLNPDGSLDTTFNPGAGTDPNTVVYALAQQANGQLLVGGSFNTFNLVSSKSIVRLNTNGSVDPSFSPAQGANDAIYSIIVDPDGTILIGGLFTSYNETRRIGVARLFSTGTLDTSFMDTGYNQFAGLINTYYNTAVQPKNFVNCMALQADGNILIAGSFNHIGGGYVTNPDGNAVPARDGYTPRQNFARLIGGTTGGPGNIGFANTNYDANENGGNAFVELTRNNGHLGVAGVTVSATDPPPGPGAAVTGVDYTFNTNYANPLYPSSYGQSWMESDGIYGPNNRPLNDVGDYYTGALPAVYVNIIENNVANGNRSLNLTLSSPTSADVFFLGGENIPLGTALDATAAAPMEIINNNAPHGTISFSSPTYTVSENGTNAVITVTRTGGSAGQVNVLALTVSGGTAVPGTTNDYLSVSNTLTFADSVTNQTFTVPVINNGIAKPDATVYLLLTNITGGGAAGLTNAVLTIVNDNFQPGHLEFTSTNFGVAENGGSALITVQRTGGSAGSISISCASSNGTATNGVNYSAATNILSWNAGDVSLKTFTVPVFHDGQVTSNLTVNLSLFNPVINGSVNNMALGLQSNSVLTISNIDFYGQPTLSAAAYNVNENAGYVTITVNRLGGIAQTMTVNYATSDGSAFQNVNYTPTSGTLTFPPGVASTNFIVPILDVDANPPIPNGNTTFNVALSSPTPSSGPGGGVTLGNPASATVTIIDNLTYNQPAGGVDPTYQGYFNGTVYSLALQTNGELLASGDFTQADGLPRNRIARLNSDGTLDDKFGDDLAGADNSVRAVLVQTDGAILIGGLFATVDGVNNNAIARLNYDGSLDSTFNPGSGADSPVYAIAETFVGPNTNSANRRIVIGGSFSSVNGINSPNVAQLQDNGTVDSTFSPAGTDGTVYAVAVYSTNDVVNSGKIIISGDFTHVGGVTRQHIARLNADGTLDATFNPGAGPNGSVRALAIQVDGNIVIGGLFTTVGNTAFNHIARVTPNGLVDSSFNPGVGANDVVSCLALQEDHKIIAGGIFTQASGVTRNRLTRLNTDGSLDPAINFGSGANDFVSSVVIQTDDRIVVGGNFTQFNGADTPYIARLYGLTTPGPGALTFTSADYQVNEDGTNVIITVQRDGGTSDSNIGNVYVQFATSDGTAVSGTNYIGVTNTLTFPVGEVFATVSIPILSNSIVQSNLTVNLTLSNPTDAALGAQPTAVLTIINDNSDVTFSSTTYRVSKGNTTGEAIITVLRTGSSVGVASVDLATSGGTAIPGQDYTPLTNTVVFANGETQETVAINILTNSMAGNRTVGLTLLNPTNTFLANPDTATLTIVDDSISPGYIMFAATNYYVSEAATNAIITLIRTNGSVGEVSVTCFTSGGTAIPGTNYAPTNVTVTFSDSITNASFMVPVFHDPLVTGDLTVNLTLTNAGNGAQLIPPLTVPLTIADADTGFAFDQPAYFVDETNHTVTIAVDRIGSTNGSFTVQYLTTNGTALAGTNYVATNGTLVFAPGETFQTFTVPILYDPQITGNLTFFIELTGPSAPGQLVNPATTAVTVLDDNTGLALATNMASVSEASSNIVVSVLRTGSTVGAVSVSFATSDGTATNGVRYNATNGVLAFLDGQTSNSFTVTIISNNIVEGNQTFNVSLSSPLGGAQILSPSNEVITVTDVNSAFSFSSAAYSIAENGVTAFITAVRTGVTNSTVSVSYTTSNLTAQAGTQYVGTSGTLTFTNGQTNATFGVGIIDNNVTGGSETVALILSNATPAATTSLTAPSQAVLTIFNDDGSLVVPAGYYLLSESGPGASNNVINPGDTVTLLLALRNSAGTNTTANLQATLLATNGITLPSPATPVTYGVLVTNGPSVSRQFQFTIASTLTNGSQIGATLQMQDGTKNLGFAIFNFTLGQTTTSYTNTNYITIYANTNATPYPSVINVSSLPGEISKVTATVSNLGHGSVSDVCILLVGPGGQPDLLMAEVGGRHTITNVSLTFDSTLSNYLTTNTPVSGTYAPTAFTTAIPFPGPAPAGPYNTNLSNLIGGSPDGTWSLYVYDNNEVDTGSINNGWSINISSLNVLTPTVDLIAGLTASANPSVSGSNLTYTITVTNSGPAPATGVFVTDTLPPGATVVSSNSSPGTWSAGASNTLIWNFQGGLATNVTATATLVITPPTNFVGSITNTVTAAANETDAYAADNTASLVTIVTNASANLVVNLTDSPDPILVGNTLTYTITVTNNGPATASNVLVTNYLAPGVILASNNPAGGTAATNAGNITITYALGSIGNGGTESITILAVPTVGGLMTNIVGIGSTVLNPLRSDNFASVKTLVQLVPLNMSVSGGNLTFSWPTSASGYVLQTSPSLDPPVWTNVPNSVSVVNGQYVVTVPVSGGPQFFRLVGSVP